MLEKNIQLSDCIRGFIFHCQYEKNLSSKTINAYSIDLEQFQLYVNEQNANVEINGISDMSKDLIKKYLQDIYGFKP